MSFLCIKGDSRYLPVDNYNIIQMLMKQLDVSALGLEEITVSESRSIDGGNPIIYLIWKAIGIAITVYGGADIISDFVAGWNSVEETEEG